MRRKFAVIGRVVEHGNHHQREQGGNENAENQGYRESGENRVIKAAATRAKPIVLTGLAAMLGAFFILDDPIFNGLAVSLIFGIFVSTLLTLVVIPVLYYAANYRKYSSSKPGVPS